MTSNIESQSADTVLMVQPVRFQFNPQTADSNRFQSDPADTGAADAQQRALAEYLGLAQTLTGAGVRVIEIADTPEPHSPDSVFPNNWITTHADGTVVVYPMEAPNRRLERRRDIVEHLAFVQGFDVRALLDLSFAETRGRYLEGTGSLVLDRPNRLAYAALASRTDPVLVDEFCRRLGYEAVTFTATDDNGFPIYHSNVMMCVGTRFAVVCLGSIRAADERRRVVDRLAASGHEVVEISLSQVARFAGNMLELRAAGGETLLAMSAQAERALNEPQRAALGAHARIVSAPIDTIEQLAGGSVRCMLAEIHLPPLAAAGDGA
ncbi:MAG: arginine deiminase-related protein [Pseudomonadota bacterium]